MWKTNTSKKGSNLVMIIMAVSIISFLLGAFAMSLVKTSSREDEIFNNSNLESNPEGSTEDRLED